MASNVSEKDKSVLFYFGVLALAMLFAKS